MPSQSSMGCNGVEFISYSDYTNNMYSLSIVEQLKTPQGKISSEVDLTPEQVKALYSFLINNFTQEELNS